MSLDKAISEKLEFWWEGLVKDNLLLSHLYDFRSHFAKLVIDSVSWQMWWFGDNDTRLCWSNSGVSQGSALDPDLSISVFYLCILQIRTFRMTNINLSLMWVL